MSGSIEKNVKLTKTSTRILNLIYDHDERAQTCSFLQLDTQIEAGVHYIFHFQNGELIFTAQAWTEPWKQYLKIQTIDGHIIEING